MGTFMNNKVENKQITLEMIRKVADYLEDCKEEYDKKFEIDNRKNQNKKYNEKRYEYGNGISNINYNIKEKSGKDMIEEDYNWFVSYFNQARNIKYIDINMKVSFGTTTGEKETDYTTNFIYVWIHFSETTARIDVTTKNQEAEAHRIYGEILNILEDSEERWNPTIKGRFLRILSFCMSVGIIFSYIFYIILKININNIPICIAEYLNNKFVIVIGQWLVAFFFGNLLARWYISSIYQTIIPRQKYAGYDYSRKRTKYKDDVDEYINASEVHFGQYWDAENRRNKIERIYKTSKKVVIIQIIISVIMLFILK